MGTFRTSGKGVNSGGRKERTTYFPGGLGEEGNGRFVLKGGRTKQGGNVRSLTAWGKKRKNQVWGEGGSEKAITG